MTWRAAMGTLTMDRRWSSVDQRLVRVRVVREHVEPHRCLARVGPEARRDVDVRQVQQALHDVVRRLVAVLVRDGHRQIIEQPAADRDVSLRPQQRCDQLGDARLVVMVVRVGVHDDVGAAGERFVKCRPDETASPRLRRFAIT